MQKSVVRFLAAVVVVAWLATTAGAVASSRLDDLGQVGSRLLGRDHRVWVYLPAGYDGSVERYPVLYAQDGNNLFSVNAPFGGWQAGATLDRLIDQGQMRPIIVVAVSNTPQRVSDYTPTRDPRHGGGGGDRYLRFLVEELKPLIDGRYRTLTAVADTGILGSSLGGLIAFHAGWTRSDVFGRVAAMSPSLWWDGRRLLADVQGHSGPLPPGRFYIDSGDQGPGADGRDDTLALRDALEALGFRHGVDLGHYLDRGAAHNEVAWRERLSRPLQLLFPPQALSPGGLGVETLIRVHWDAGWGHRVSLRGTARGWSGWQRDVHAQWVGGNVWVHRTTAIPDGDVFDFKVLIDGNEWEAGANRRGRGGAVLDVHPRFTR